MISFKRFLHIILIIAVLGGIFLIYTVNENRPASVHTMNTFASEREFTGAMQVEKGEKPKIRIIGDPEDERCGKIYGNVRQLCEDLHLTVTEEECLDGAGTGERDLVIFCDASVSRYADLEELEQFIAEGGRVILAAGLAEGDGDSDLWPACGILYKADTKDCEELLFEKPLLPVQPEWACHYDGDSDSVWIEVDDDASVYIQDAENNNPILYTYAWQKGSVCLINGAFLADARCMGLLTGAIGEMLPDFVYPVLGVKAVFLDNFPMMTPADDELCSRVYGYSAEGFLQDVIWPAFQGVCLRTNTLYTSSIVGMASSAEGFEGETNDAVFTTICKPSLQFGGEFVYAVDCREDGNIVVDENFIHQFSAVFPNYTVQGMVVEMDNFSPEMFPVPEADFKSVRGMLGSSDTRLSWEDGKTVFPAATVGNSMEDGNFFAIYSVLGAYGMISHVFDVSMLISEDETTASWDKDKLQIGFFESEVLGRASWLESRTLSQTEGDVKSYLELDYDFIRNGSSLELNCSNAVKGQAFFYHTDSRIVDAEGLTYEDVGNGYWLLRIQENHGMITLKEGE